jgi:hypothetical protein
MGSLHLELSNTNKTGDTKYNVSVMLVMILRVAMCKMSSCVRPLSHVDPIPPRANIAYLPPGGLILSLAHFGCILLF